MKKVMVVDDDKAFLGEVEELLKLSGYDVTAVSEGEEVSAMVKKTQPDVMLLDLKLPGKSGYKIAEELRGMSEGKDLHIIAITGVYTETVHKLLMKMVGFAECLTKPVNPLDMIAAIEKTNN